MNNLVSDLSDAVEGRIRYAFDLSRIAKEVLPKGEAALSSRTCIEYAKLSHGKTLQHNKVASISLVFEPNRPM